MAMRLLCSLFALITYANAATTVTVTVLHSISWDATAQTAILIATIKPIPATPWKKVSFFDNGTPISPGGLNVTELADGSGVQATFGYKVTSGSTTTSQTHPITAKYTQITSPKVNLIVWPGATSTTLNFDKTTYRLGDVVTATSNVAVLRRPHPNGFNPTQAQWFLRSKVTNKNVKCDGGVKFTKTGTGGTYQCKFKANGLIGEEFFWAVYKGDGAYYGGSSNTNNKKIKKDCPVGFADCDGDEVCEVNTDTDPNHCGSCTNACDLANSDFNCTAGECKIQQCDLDFFNCDTNESNGCEYGCAAQHPVTEDVNVSLAEFPGTNNVCTDKQNKLKIGQIPRQGSGNDNLHWVRVKRGGVELGLRLEQRQVGSYAPTGGKSKIYKTTACRSAGATGAGKARWNYGISVDLRAGTGSFAGKKFQDFDIKLIIDIAAGSATATELSATKNFPYVIDVVDTFGAGLIADTCSCGALPGDYTINGKNATGVDCATLAQNFKGELYFLQESSNIVFQIGDWDINKDAFLNITLSLTPKVSDGGDVCTGAICPLSTNIYALIEKVTCPTGNN